MTMVNSPPTRFKCIDQGLAEHLVSQYGSPIYVMDEVGLNQRWDDFQLAANSAYANSTVAVSYKTNPTRGLLAQLHRRGAYAEAL